LGRYRLLGRIASGGMADVYAGCVKGEAGFERVVAIKRMATALAQDEEFVTMFLQEAKLAAQIRSAHVVQTLDLGRSDEGTPYLVMDLVVGASVAKLAKRAAERSLQVPVDVAVSILLDTCQGLHDAHEATARDGTPLGIVHRDVSPHNILVGEDGLARVADFGIARALDSSAEGTRDHLRGKLAYFSPEQARGETLDRRSDVFSLGIVAWEILTGERLFRSDHPVRTLTRVMQDPIARVDTLRKDVPEQVALVVERALERDIPSRYPTAADLASALRKAALEAGLQPHTSAVSAFLATCCAYEIDHIGALLRTRTSWVTGSPEPLALEPLDGVDRSTTTAPDVDVDPPSTTERTTQPFHLVQSHVGPTPAGVSKFRGTRMAIGIVVACVTALILVLSFWPKAPTATQEPPASVAVQGPPPPPSNRDLLRVGTSFFHAIPTTHLAPAIFWSTVEASPEGRVKASFVRQVPTLENGMARILPGGRLEVRWELLPGLRWSDGSPVRSDDLLMSHKLLPSARAIEARRVDETTAVFVWSDHWAEAVQGFEPYPSSVLEPHVLKGGPEAAREVRRTQPTPGLGPYRVKEARVGEHMIIEANPHFAGPPPSIARIELRCAQSSAQLVDAFERGDLDLIVPNSITVDQAEALRKKRPDAVHMRVSPHYVLVQPDLSHPLLASVEARQALLTALDRMKLTREIYGRTDLVAHCPVVGLGPGAVATYSFDRARASSEFQRLKLAGASLPLYHSTWSMDVRIANLVRDDLQAAGLTITLQSVERVSELFRKGRHGGLALYSLRDVGPETVAAHFNLPSLGADYDRSVRHSGFDDGVASLLDREERAMDPLRRAQLLQELWIAYAERLPTLPLAFLLERVVVDPHLRGWDGNPSQRFGADIERWYFVR